MVVESIKNVVCLLWVFQLVTITQSQFYVTESASAYSQHQLLKTFCWQFQGDEAVTTSIPLSALILHFFANQFLFIIFFTRLPVWDIRIVLYYMMLPKSSGSCTIVKKKFVTNTLTFHCFLHSSSIGNPAFFPWLTFHASLKVLRCECVNNLLWFCLGLFSHVRTMAFQL